MDLTEESSALDLTEEFLALIETHVQKTGEFAGSAVWSVVCLPFLLLSVTEVWLVFVDLEESSGSV